MATTVKITSDKLIKRLDDLQLKYNLETRQNLVAILLRKAADFTECNGYDELLKIPTKTQQKDCPHDRAELFSKRENGEYIQYMKCLNCGLIQKI